MGRFVRGKDLKASTIKSPNTLGDFSGGAILADSITSIGDITVIAGNITADVITGNSYVGVTASPAGSTTEVQYNNAGSLDASANFTYDGTFGLTVQEDITSIGNVNGNNVVATNDVTTYTVTATGNVTGGNLLTGGLVSATGNVTGGNLTSAGIVDVTGNVNGGNLVTTGNVSGGNLVTGNVTISDTDVTVSLGNISTGNVTIGDADITLTTGNISTGNITISDASISATGNISSGNMTVTGNVDADSFNFTTLVFGSGNVLAGNLNTYASGNVTGGNILTGNVTIADATVSATGNVTGGNLLTTGNVLGNVNGFDIGYRAIPQVSFTGNTTTALTDNGKHYYATLGGGTYSITIPSNANVAYPIGSTITLVSGGTGNLQILTQAEVSLYLAGNGTAGNRTLGDYGMATLVKVETNKWFVNGTGLS